ncbi:MAG: NAD-dependent epimerase/dehydratase family protein [Oligoflexales bacterium]
MLVIGPGYLGKLLATNLLKDGDEVHTLSRNDPGIVGTSHFSCDIRFPFSLKNNYDLVYYLVSASGYSEKAYQDAYYHGLDHALKAVLQMKTKPFFVFASSTSLFKENSGGQVVEDSQISLHPISRALADGESLLLESGVHSSVLRFSGIYGPKRDRLAVQVARGEASLRQKASISNRIHLFDAVGILKFISELSDPKPMYLVCDNMPSPYNEILVWLSQLLIEKKHLDYELPDTMHRRISNKFCSNRLIRKEGYDFLFPSFKEGFLQIINESNYLRGVYETNGQA